MEGPLVGGLIAQEQSELPFLVPHREIVLHGHVLEIDSALDEPVVLRHSFNEEEFGDGGGFVLGVKARFESKEYLRVFGLQDGECAAKSVLEIIFAGSGFSLGAFRTGAVLRVGLVGGHLGFGGHNDLLLKWKTPEEHNGSTGVFENLEANSASELSVHRICGDYKRNVPTPNRGIL